MSSSTTSICAECDGPLPWKETNPHADKVNGKICSSCGHFYGIPAFGGKFNWCALVDYCFDREWDAVLKRVAYVPEEATYIGRRGSTPLKWAIYYKAPVHVVQVLVDADPDAVTVESDFIGCPLFLALFSGNFNDYAVDVTKIMVTADNDVLRLTPAEGVMESVLGGSSSDFNDTLEMAANRPIEESMETVLAYQDGENVEEGVIRRAFRLLSLLVNAEYHGSLDDDIPFCLIHSIAGCRDPNFQEKGLLLLSLRFHPEQLSQADENGKCPLHIAVSTINRDKEEYDTFYVEPDEEEEDCKREELRKEFGYCSHSPDDPCNCTENFEWYYEKMKDEHLFDKKYVIEALVKALPKSAGFRDQDKNLPLHLALACGKRWDGGVQAIALAYPQAMHSKDSEHKLYPFMLAAISGDTDTAFELLRFEPNVLTNVLTNVLLAQSNKKRKRSGSAATVTPQPVRPQPNPELEARPSNGQK